MVVRDFRYKSKTSGSDQEAAASSAVNKFVRTTIQGAELDRTAQDSTERPTDEAYRQIEEAFNYFSEELFFKHYDTRLPPVIFTLARSTRYAGYYDHRRWHRNKDRAARRSEIALNPIGLGNTPRWLSTLVHEMAHLANAELPDVFGKPGKGAYHSKHWAELMETIGLMPSNTGQPGGKKTGFRMTHYVIEGGAFDIACRKYMSQGGAAPWLMNSLSLEADGFNPPGGGGGNNDSKNAMRKRRSKTKYSCPGCSLNAWAKPAIRLTCGTCGHRMRGDDPGTSVSPSP